MKSPFLALLCVSLFVGCQGDSNNSSTDIMNEEEQVVESSEESASLLRHVVLFKFKEDASAQQIQEVVDAFAALPSKISEIHAYEYGINNSPEGLNHGYEHCFIVTFLSDEDRAVYLDHPDHLAFVEILLPILEEPTVVDFWAKS